MRLLKTLLPHLIFILSGMFLVFLVLDQFNPMMNFVNHSVSHWLLAALCVCGITQSVLLWIERK